MTWISKPRSEFGVRRGERRFDGAAVRRSLSWTPMMYACQPRRRAQATWGIRMGFSMLRGQKGLTLAHAKRSGSRMISVNSG